MSLFYPHTLLLVWLHVEFWVKNNFPKTSENFCVLFEVVSSMCCYLMWAMCRKWKSPMDLFVRKAVICWHLLQETLQEPTAGAVWEAGRSEIVQCDFSFSSDARASKLYYLFITWKSKIKNNFLPQHFIFHSSFQDWEFWSPEQLQSLAWQLPLLFI